MKLITILATFMVASLSFGVNAEGITFEHISLDEALKKAKAENKPLFIDIYATWCGPCKMLDRDVFIDDDLGTYMNENFINLKLDGEKGDGDVLMTEFDMSAFPTMLYLSADKVELNRIVGYVEANGLLETSKTVIDPTSSKLYKLQQKYNAGNRDQSLMKEYIKELLNRDKDYEEVLTLYLELYPDLDLSKEDDFLIFCMGIEDLEHPLNQSFLDDIEVHHDRFPEMTFGKVKLMIFQVCRNAEESGDIDQIDKFVDELIDPLNKILEEAVTKEELQELILENIEG